MIATCTNCPARYQLENAKIPNRVIQVRCPSCQGVFALDGTQANLDEVSIAPDPVFETPEISGESNYQEIPDVLAPDPVPVAAAPKMEIESDPSASVATLDEPAPATGSQRRRRRCKEEMLARALVSDILVYNRDTRDAGLAEGNLLEVLGGEIKKSWELYKEKVTPEVANSTTYFREALNEILADGTSIF